MFDPQRTVLANERADRRGLEHDIDINIVWLLRADRIVTITRDMCWNIRFV